jgi:DNA polymerase III subunit epsilon
MTFDLDDVDTIEHQDPEKLAARLEANGGYRILRRVTPRTHFHPPDGTATRRGIFLDVETTGLDSASDEIIELAMVPFDFSDDGRIFALHPSFDALRDPGRPIPAAITALTGITDAMVAGTSIEVAEVTDFLNSVALVVAHNAAFDRPFCERFCPAFASTAWACSWREIPWSKEGFDGTKLSQLAAGHGLFFDGHRAEEDCRAGIEVLSRPLPRSGKTALATLLESARQTRWRLWATGAPYGKRGILKQRGYRWNNGCDGRPKSWHIDIEDGALEAERMFLEQKIFHCAGVALNVRRFTAFDRYSHRC